MITLFQAISLFSPHMVVSVYSQVSKAAIILYAMEGWGVYRCVSNASMLQVIYLFWLLKFGNFVSLCLFVCVCVYQGARVTGGWVGGLYGEGGGAASASAPMTSPEFKVGRASPSEGEERGEGGSSGRCSHYTWLLRGAARLSVCVCVFMSIQNKMHLNTPETTCSCLPAFWLGKDGRRFCIVEPLNYVLLTGDNFKAQVSRRVSSIAFPLEMEKEKRGNNKNKRCWL